MAHSSPNLPLDQAMELCSRRAASREAEAEVIEAQLEEDHHEVGITRESGMVTVRTQRVGKGAA